MPVQLDAPRLEKGNSRTMTTHYRYNHIQRLNERRGGWSKRKVSKYLHLAPGTE